MLKRTFGAHFDGRDRVEYAGSRKVWRAQRPTYHPRSAHTYRAHGGYRLLQMRYGSKRFRRSALGRGDRAGRDSVSICQRR